MEVSIASPSIFEGSGQLNRHNGFKEKKRDARCWKSEGIMFRHED